MKEKYIELMEKALSAYTFEHIKRYFNDVKKDGLTEHGFPRLTANIGILIAHGRCEKLRPIFLEMMEFCCKSIPVRKAANDFSVREIVSCIRELEKSDAADKEDIERWKEYLSSIDPDTCYNIFAVTSDDKVKNWALFSGVSEFYRKQAGLGGSDEWIDTQLASQLKWLDENGMYMDGTGETHHPIVYDLVPRGLFALLLNEGYRGKYYNEIDDCIKKAGLLTLKMQSPNGEIPFGGRSNQFIHNEAWLAVICEYEAKRYASEGNDLLARKFKTAVKRAIAVCGEWLSRDPVYHIKNRFPTDTKYGCEGYAYFDKYMITAASFLHAAYQICGDYIPDGDEKDLEPAVFAASRHFHKVFLKAGGYGLEFDLDGDPHYDASGLGRVHKAGAPSPICLSLPCPKEPTYVIDIERGTALSLCTGVKRNGVWEFASDSDSDHEITHLSHDNMSAFAVLRDSFSCGTAVVSSYTVTEGGVEINVSGDGDIAFMLPAFFFDGEAYSDIKLDKNALSIAYNGYICRYITDGSICGTGAVCANRNGHYKAYFASGNKKLSVKIEIFKGKAP